MPFENPSHLLLHLATTLDAYPADHPALLVIADAPDLAGAALDALLERAGEPAAPAELVATVAAVTLRSGTARQALRAADLPGAQGESRTALCGRALQHGAPIERADALTRLLSDGAETRAADLLAELPDIDAARLAGHVTGDAAAALLTDLTRRHAAQQATTGRSDPQAALTTRLLRNPALAERLLATVEVPDPGLLAGLFALLPDQPERDSNSAAPTAHWAVNRWRELARTIWRTQLSATLTLQGIIPDDLDTYAAFRTQIPGGYQLRLYSIRDDLLDLLTDEQLTRYAEQEAEHADRTAAGARWRDRARHGENPGTLWAEYRAAYHLDGEDDEDDSEDGVFAGLRKHQLDTWENVTEQQVAASYESLWRQLLNAADRVAAPPPAPAPPIELSLDPQPSWYRPKSEPQSTEAGRTAARSVLLHAAARLAAGHDAGAGEGQYADLARTLLAEGLVPPRERARLRALARRHTDALRWYEPSPWKRLADEFRPPAPPPTPKVPVTGPDLLAALGDAPDRAQVVATCWKAIGRYDLALDDVLALDDDPAGALIEMLTEVYAAAARHRVTRSPDARSALTCKALSSAYLTDTAVLLTPARDALTVYDKQPGARVATVVLEQLTDNVDAWRRLLALELPNAGAPSWRSLREVLDEILAGA